MKSSQAARRFPLVHCPALLVLLLVGCGAEGRTRFPVSGAVQFHGQSVEHGEIRFIPTDAKFPTEAAPIQQGRFSTRLVPGEKQVSILAIRDHPTQREPALEPGKTLPIQVQYLPAKFNDQTELTVTIDRPRDDLDFSLTE